MFWVIWLACAHPGSVSSAVEPAGCSAVGAPAPLAPLIGAWKAADSSAIFRVCMVNGQIGVDGWDSGDKEAFVVSDIAVQGAELRFTSLMPSTNWSVKNTWRKEQGVWVNVRGEDPGVRIDKVEASPP